MPGVWGGEVRLDGMEITQFTYFQEIGGIPLNPITGEITWDRTHRDVSGSRSITSTTSSGPMLVTYGDVHHRSEVEFSRYNFEEGEVPMLMATFQAFEGECQRLLEKKLTLPAYDYCIKTLAHV